MVETVEERLARIETKIDMVLERSGDTETRLRTVERKQWYMSGCAAVAAFLASKLTAGNLHFG